MNTLWEASSANHLPSLTFLPTFTATAWYHKVLAPPLQALSLRAVLDEAEAWTLDVYAPALAKGVTRLTIDERMVIIEGLVKYTGVSRAFAEASNLEIDDGAYRKELLRSVRRTVGRLDSRYIGTMLKTVSSDLRHAAVLKYTDAIDWLPDDTQGSIATPQVGGQNSIHRMLRRPRFLSLASTTISFVSSSTAPRVGTIFLVGSRASAGTTRRMQWETPPNRCELASAQIRALQMAGTKRVCWLD